MLFGLLLVFVLGLLNVALDLVSVLMLLWCLIVLVYVLHTFYFVLFSGVSTFVCCGVVVLVIR